MIAYHRPATLDEALSLLQSDHRMVLAGGTVVNAGGLESSREAVDVQALDLDGITDASETLVIGATTRLQDLVDSEIVPGVIGDLARAELPSTLRTMATVGGTIATNNPDSALIAGLLVHEAEITIASPGTTTVVALGDLEPGALHGGIITSIEIATDGTTAAARTGRTPADAPIVSAVGRRDPEGGIRLAITGAGPAPILVDPADPTATLDPVGDFRGSREYRLRLVEVLSGRVLEELG